MGYGSKECKGCVWQRDRLQYRSVTLRIPNFKCRRAVEGPREAEQEGLRMAPALIWFVRLFIQSEVEGLKS
jgi:hypothetical protein